MSLKAEIEAWVSALDAYEAQDFDKAISVFDTIADSSKIWFNIALIYATLGEHEKAIHAYKEAMTLDEYFAVAAFQSGVSNFLLGRYREAYDDFEASYQHMRTNFTIDYAQIGLKFRLYSCEILFNRGLSRICLGRTESGLADLKRASDQKQTAEHTVIDEALDARGEGYTVFSIPVGVLFRPSETKVRNLQARDYLGKARLVAAIEERDAFTGFTGVARQEQEKAREAAKRNQEQSAEHRAAPPGMERSNTLANVPTYKPETIVRPDLRRRPTDVTVAVGLPSASTFASTSSEASPISSSKVGRTKTKSSRDPARPSEPTTPAQRQTRSSRSDSGVSSYSSPRSSSLPFKPPAPSTAASSPRRPSGAGPLPAIPQELDEVHDLFETYSKLDEAVWEGEDSRKKHDLSPTKVKSWMEKTVKPNLGRSPSGRKKSFTTRSPRHHRPNEDKGYESEGPDDKSGLQRIRIKLHYAGDVRGLPIDADLDFHDLIGRIESKFAKTRLKLRFKDEDGSLISLVDDGDWECAVDVARQTARGRAESKLELFVD